MLRDVRAGLTSISLTTNLTPLLCCTQTEFSYHAHKFQLSSNFGHKDRCNENRFPVPVLLQQPVVLDDIQLAKGNPAEAVDYSVNSRSLELGLSLEWQRTPSSGQKTYADVVQETGKSIDAGRPCGKIDQQAGNISDKTMKAQEDYRRISDGVEYFEDETEDIRNFVIRAHNYQNPVHRLQTSNSSTPSTFSEDSHISGCSDGTRLCRMAEKFCFEELENAAFFRAFDEYNRYRRRMAYTRRFLSSVEDSRSSELTVFTAFSLDNCDVDCSWMFDGEDRECSSIERSELAGTDSDSSVDIALKKGRGAFKVLKNFRECTSSTKALYTNSWRPGEIYLLRRRHSMKNV
ncbi:uncharacterized protein LOC112493639 [Cephus cinctus]|uniref:Uncharacterized protein LOC112493639 n=1 Tax=Cephus cinctus TaxID=211228 RepID=A0AAJ7VWN9_CEPCN|nr:uncharacterized protein LOC112493639 [Cephus cinctus]